MFDDVVFDDDAVVCPPAGVFTVTSPLELDELVVESGCRASSEVVEPLTFNAFQKLIRSG